MTTTNTAPQTVQVYWRLPENLVADCADRDKGGEWAEGFRSVLKRAAAQGYQLVPEGPNVSKAMSLPADVEEYLFQESLRLTGETGQNWTPMKVAREIWRRKCLPSLNRKRQAAQKNAG